MRNVFAAVAAASAFVAVTTAAQAADLPGSSFLATFDAQEFLDTPLEGGSYTAELARAYQQRAAYEASYGVDGDENWYDATAFVAKGQAAAAGEEVTPWDPADLELGAAELVLARHATIDMAAKYKDENPRACAQMVAFYDHFIEEVREKRHSITEPSAMLGEWKTAYAGCIGVRSIYGYPVTGCRPTDRKERAHANRVAADLGAAGRSGLLAAIQADLTVAGNTSTTGSEKRNERLSACRAEWIKNLMVKKGVPEGLITTVAQGETALEVATADGVEEYRNRRTDITLQ